MNTKPKADCRDWNTETFFKDATVGDVRRCLEDGANIEAQHLLGDWTPLHLAAHHSSIEIVNTLLEWRADVNARARPGHPAYSRMPLHVAATYGTPENVTALVKAGADLEAQDDHGNTPLHRAASDGSPENVIALLNEGAAKTARNKEGKLPRDLASNEVKRQLL